MILLDISSWWQSLPGFEKMFWAIALPFSALFVVQTILSFAAGDGDSTFGDADVAMDHDHGMGYGFFTIKNFIAFFTIFGWTGIALSKGNVNKGITITVALIAGALMVVLMMLLFRSMSKLKHSGTLEIQNAIGKIGETYLFIPAARTGIGKVHLKVQGSLREMQAITDELNEIPTGRLIKVLDVLNNSILIVTTKTS